MNPTKIKLTNKAKDKNENIWEMNLDDFEDQILNISSPIINSIENFEEINKNSEKSKRTKSLFTKEEDIKLKKAVREYGDKDWTLIASFVESRTRRQCRERWKKFLCPSLNRSPWTNEEDELLLKKYEEHGPKWSFFSKFFKNRTDINIKTRYTVLKRKINRERELVELTHDNSDSPITKDLSLDSLSNENLISDQKEMLKKKENARSIGNEQSMKDKYNNTNEISKKDDSEGNINSFLDFTFKNIADTMEYDYWDALAQDCSATEFNSMFFM